MSVVYFIQAGEDGAVKIGVAVDPIRRLTMLQTGSVDRLRLLASEPGDVVLEQFLHTRFADLRIRGEWFRFEGGLKKHVDGLPRYFKTERPFGPTALAKATGWTQTYCCEMLKGNRAISIERAAHIYRCLRMKMGPLVDATDGDCEALLRLCPNDPVTRRTPVEKSA